MPTVRGDFSALLVPGAKSVYVDAYNALPAQYPTVFNIDTSGRAFEDDLVLTGLGVAVTRAEGEAIAFDRPRYRGKVRYIHAGYGLGYEITREAVEDDQYGALNSSGAKNLALSMRAAEETTGWGIFDGAFTTIMAYDGVSLINTAHPLGDGNTLANQPTAATNISVSALKASLERFWSLTTDRGIKITMVPVMVVVSHMNWWATQEILGAPYLSTGAQGQYTPNVTEQMGLRPFKTNYLSDTNAWYCLASKAQHKLKWYWRRTPSPESGYDGRRGISWFGQTARWSAGVTDWRGVDGSAGV